MDALRAHRCCIFGLPEENSALESIVVMCPSTSTKRKNLERIGMQLWRSDPHLAAQTMSTVSHLILALPSLRLCAGVGLSDSAYNYVYTSCIFIYLYIMCIPIYISAAQHNSCELSSSCFLLGLQVEATSTMLNHFIDEQGNTVETIAIR